MDLAVFVEVALEHVDGLFQVAELGLVLPEDVAVDLLLLDLLLVHNQELFLEHIVVQDVLDGVVEVVLEHYDARVLLDEVFFLLGDPL